MTKGSLNETNFFHAYNLGLHFSAFLKLFFEGKCLSKRKKFPESLNNPGFHQ